MKGQLVLRLLMPFVPTGYRTATGAALLAVGTLLSALASPDLFAVLPESWAAWANLLQGWGAAATGLGIRFAGKGRL